MMLFVDTFLVLPTYKKINHCKGLAYIRQVCINLQEYLYTFQLCF
jgi:hypothetical protein